MVIEFQNINLGNEENQIEEDIIPDPSFEQIESLHSYAKFNISLSLIHISEPTRPY